MLNLRQIIYRAYLLSKVVRDNFTDTQNFVNNLQTQINNILTPPAGSEVANARDFYPVLRDRLQGGFKAVRHQLIVPGVVAAQSTPNMTVKISAGEALIDGVGVVFAGQNSGTITAPTFFRYDVVAINSDSSISVLTGNDSNDPELPAVSISQLAVAIIRLTSATTSITNSIIENIRNQGCVYWKDNLQKYEFKISDAVADAGEGDIYIGRGSYYEEVDLTALSGISLIYENGANHYRPSAAGRCVKGINTLGNETTFNKVINGKFFGNSKAGSVGLVDFVYADDVLLENCIFDSNSASSADRKTFSFTNCFRDQANPDYIKDSVQYFS